MGGSFGKKKSKIIIVGLDNSGKSTMINMLKPKKVSKKFMDLINKLPYKIIVK
jgi:GTPase SAR1 family protein